MHLVLNMFIFTRTLVTYARIILSPAAASTFKVCARKQNLLILRIACLDRSRWRYRSTLIGIRSFLSRKRDGKPRMIGGQFVVVRVGIHQLSVSPNTSHPMLQICSKLLHGNSMPSLNSSLVHTTHTHAVPEKRSAIELSSRHLNEAVN